MDNITVQNCIGTAVIRRATPEYSVNGVLLYVWNAWFIAPPARGHI